ncbi:MAG: hypothetical protein ACOH5I_08535 [Oligoflexus sp.]
MKKTLTRLAALFLCLGSHNLLAIVKPKTTPILRLEGDLHNLRTSPQDKHLAFTDRFGRQLRILSMQSGEVFELSANLIGASYFWAPDGFRLFYREMYQTEKDGIESRLMVYDLKLHRNVELEKIPGSSGFLSFDPQDLRFYLMKEQGILSRTIVYPDERLARWQRAKRKQEGRWILAPQRVLWVTHGGLTMRDLRDDGSGLQSFDISPDGSSIVWSTQEGKIYFSKSGAEARHLAEGWDAKWHPTRPLIVYTHLHKFGGRTVHTNLKMVDIYGRHKDLTRTVNRSERWPIWSYDGRKIYYTIEQSTDLFAMDFEP